MFLGNPTFLFPSFSPSKARLTPLKGLTMCRFLPWKSFENREKNPLKIKTNHILGQTMSKLNWSFPFQTLWLFGAWPPRQGWYRLVRLHGMNSWEIPEIFSWLDWSRNYRNYWNVHLVGGIPTPLKNVSSSVGMMTFPIYGKKMFQTTNPPWLSL